MSLLHMSFIAAVFISVVIIIRAVMINRLPKNTFLILWGIIILRLLFPFTITSQFSIYSLLPQREIIYNPTMPDGALPTFAKAADVIFYGNEQYMIGQADTVAENEGGISVIGWKRISVRHMAWLTGSAVCALFFLASYKKSKKKFAASIPVQNEFIKHWLQEHRIRRTIEIRQSDIIKVPLTYGLFHPVILMPANTDWKNEQLLTYILMHEYIHIKRLDIITKALLLITVCIYWFHPFVWIMYILCNRDIELSCDEKVVAVFGGQARAEYAYSLIHMEEAKSGLMPLCNSFSKNATEERITAIMKTKRTTCVTILAAVALVAVVSVAFATTAKNKVTDNSKNTASEAADNTNGMAYRVSQSADFEKYEQLGLSYDKESGYLLYDNKKVGYFMDEKAEGVYTRFVDEAGEIGVSIARDNQREIVDIVDFPMSEVHFDDDIATVEESTSSDKSEAVYAMAYEENDETVSDVSKEYMEYGITVNAAEGAWSYNGKTVAALYDAGRKIYIYNGNTNNDTVYIHVIRDKSGKIEALEEITKEAMQSLLKNTDTELLIEEKIQLLELELEQMETENTSLKEKISDTEDEMKLLENESARGTDKENEVKILLKEKEQLTEKQRIVEKQIETLTDERKAIQKSAE